MPSPFPGMNPYLEQEDVWQDFHDRMIPAISDALSPQVSPHFIVRIEERLYFHEPSAQERVHIGNADVSVSRRQDASMDGQGNLATLHPPEEILITAPISVEKQPFLEIRDRRDRELIAVIELLSLSNKKAGADREVYLTKRETLLRSSSHFVEIDFLRGWQRMPYEPPPKCDYCVVVSQFEKRPKAVIWRLGLRDQLPAIPIPLRAPCELVTLDLQAVLHNVYDRAYYRDSIYEGKPHPLLSPEDSAWAASHIGK